MRPGTLLLFLILGLAAAAPPPEATADAQRETAVPSVLALKDGEYYPALAEALDRAKSEIVLSMFLFKTNGFEGNQPDGILSRLSAAAKRGVPVFVLLEREKDRRSQVNEANEETAKRLRKAGIVPVFDSPERTMHAKIAVIDRRLVFLGSHNFTQSALKYNHEVSLRVDSPALAEELLRYVRSIER
jgi:phosphatidylserine/phosphatidylglycerophosphate/cardiolipin synthase-like enzyme